MHIMTKFVRQSGLLLILLLLTLTLAACGGEAGADVAPYGGATVLQVDQATQDSFKNTVKGIKEAKLQTFAIKDDPSAVRAYYDSQYKDKGWTDKHEEIKEAATQVQNQNGWALAFEKGGKVVSLVLTPAAAAAARFPEAQGQNVLVVVSATK